MGLARVVREHLDGASNLWVRRDALTRASRATLDVLQRFDDRLAAHLDGLVIAGEEAWPLCETALEQPSAEIVFVAAVLAVEDRDDDRLVRLFTLTETSTATLRGLMSAFGWAEPDRLRGVVLNMLSSRVDGMRRVGIAACAMHGLDPGLISARRLEDEAPAVRAQALRAAGQIGLTDAADACVAAIANDADPDCAFWASWSAALLGDRATAFDALVTTSSSASPHRRRAFELACQASDVGEAHGLLQQLAEDASQRRLIRGSGIVGDCAYVPWLIGQMGDARHSRLAGEGFSLITGIDLSLSNLACQAPQHVDSRPTDDPDDPNVDLDPDDGLPWPDRQKVEKWWAANAARFEKGARYFLGKPVTREHCIDVLRTGYQRQRILAAQYLCVLEPGTPLFNTSAPAWRQQRVLSAAT